MCSVGSRGDTSEPSVRDPATTDHCSSDGRGSMPRLVTSKWVPLTGGGGESSRTSSRCAVPVFSVDRSTMAITASSSPSWVLNRAIQPLSPWVTSARIHSRGSLAATVSGQVRSGPRPNQVSPACLLCFSSSRQRPLIMLPPDLVRITDWLNKAVMDQFVPDTPRL